MLLGMVSLERESKMKQKIFDAHFHLWDLKQIKLAWLENLPHLKRNFSLDDLKKAYEGFEFLGGLYIEADSQDKTSEARFALALKERGIGFCLGSLEEGICAFREVLHTGKRGAKRLFDEDFKVILKSLEQRDLVFEACMKNEEVGMLQALLKAYPNLKICLNHLGNPKECNINEYKETLRDLSRFPQLFIKLSAPDDLTFDSKEWMNEVFGLMKFYFGEKRLLFGSNFPVARLCPKEWMTLIEQSGVFKNLQAIFYQNALNLYKRS